ncbi:tripartite tricarboxylate transporter substrate binding protein [Alcaligenaceae bacterium]|nr:tripartite tricarboxylate transporter substrate binding protein [Alcaligenaceae bacterium]
MKRIVSLLCPLILALPGAVSAESTKWPERPVVFVQPYGPGTALDAATRFMAARLEPKWKQPIVVDHKPGANGVIGTQAVARAEPDGYTFLFTGPGHFSNEFLMESIPFDPIKDFEPVAQLATVMLVLVVPASKPFNTVDDLVAYAKAHPGKLTYSSGGVGSSQHLSAALFTDAVDIDVLHVPYKTQAQAVVDIVGGSVDFGFAALATAAPQMQAGKLKALAVTGPSRSRSLPDVPTMQEQGVKDYAFYSFNAVFAPKGTPAGIVEKVSSDLEEIAKSEDFQALLTRQGIEDTFLDAKGWANAVAEERKNWKNAAEAGKSK